MAFGRTVFGASSIFPTRVSADGSPRCKAGGITIDWANTVAAPGSDTTLPDGSIVKSGSKYLRYGQILTKITGAAIQTVTIGGGASGGTFTLSVVDALGAIQTTSGIAFGATASTVQTAVRALSNVGTTLASVTGTGAAATAEVNTITWTSPTAGDVVTVAVSGLPTSYPPLQFTVNSTATTTSTTTQLKEAWNGRADLAAIGTATGTTTGIVTGAAAGQSLGLTVTQQGTGTAANVVTGNAQPYSITFDTSLGAVTLTGSPASLTGGTPTLTVASVAPGGNAGWYGPYDPAATDGRASLTRGSAFILDELVLQYSSGALHIRCV